MKDALFEAVNNFSKKDIAQDYEKSMARLFNMYCRHVFWSLIQKDDIERIFSVILQGEREEAATDVKSFSVFLKVLGNECFITGNKVYIKSFKVFLKKVVSMCCKNKRFQSLLRVLIEDGILGAYQMHMEDLHKEPQAYSTKRIEDFFKTESKASQLMNPYIIVPFLK